MPRYKMPEIFSMEGLPEYQRLMSANSGARLKAKQVAVIYSKAVDWYAIIGTIWPDFSTIDYFLIEVAYLFVHDPDEKYLPVELYDQLAGMIATFWKIQLDDLYPNGDWKVEIQNDPEITVEATISKRK